MRKKTWPHLNFQPKRKTFPPKPLVLLWPETNQLIAIFVTLSKRARGE